MAQAIKLHVWIRFCAGFDVFLVIEACVQILALTKDIGFSLFIKCSFVVKTTPPLIPFIYLINYCSRLCLPAFPFILYCWFMPGREIFCIQLARYVVAYWYKIEKCWGEGKTWSRSRFIFLFTYQLRYSDE